VRDEAATGKLLLGVQIAAGLLLSKQLGASLSSGRARMMGRNVCLAAPQRPQSQLASAVHTSETETGKLHVSKEKLGANHLMHLDDRMSDGEKSTGGGLC
jgi:hypothetical protein